jgi:hypoxanthine-guanine phosphoribosyltransferase
MRLRVPPALIGETMSDTPAHPDIEQVLITADAVQARVNELGATITASYSGRAPILIGVLKGAVVFMTDLARAIDLPVELDFMAVSSYGNSTETDLRIVIRRCQQPPLPQLQVWLLSSCQQHLYRR